jgi:acetyl-CoA acetyltransferase
VTAGNSCPITDGAAAPILIFLMLNDDVCGMGNAWQRPGPCRMGLGPVSAIHKLFRRTGLKLADFDLVEINEAFAVQVLACSKAMTSSDFARSV